MRMLNDIFVKGNSSRRVREDREKFASAEWEEAKGSRE